MRRFILSGVMAVLLVPALCLGAEFDASSTAEIQAALDTAASNGEDDTIRIAAGTFSVDETLNFVSTEQYSLRIEGQGRGGTVLDGGGQVRAMTIDTAQTSTDYWTTITISGISFINGWAEGGGGGLSVIVDKADVVIDTCGFEGNVAEPPEETYIDSDRLNGGGGLFVGGGNLLRHSSADVSIRKCEFLNNRSSVFGGGAYVYNSTLAWSDTIIEQNVFIGNSAALDGGGLWVDVDFLASMNNTIIENSSGQDGGGVYIFLTHQGNIFNNIIWNNSAENEGEDFYLRHAVYYMKTFSNILGGMTLGSDNTHSEGENTNVDPLLGDNYTPLAGSPCIDTGDNEAPELGCGDFNDHERIHGGTVDRGAIEFGSSDPADPNCGNTDPTDPTDPPITPPSIDGGGGGCFLGTVMGIDKDSEVYKAVKRIADRQKSPEFQADLETVRKQIRPIVKKQCRQFNQKAALNARRATDSTKPELLVFVSTSMPSGTTMTFVREAHQIKEKSEVRFVLRGYPEGGLSDYLKGVRSNQYDLNLTVDPFLYNTYEVEKVPAVVVNRAVKIDHPRNLKSALTRTQAASDQNLTALIRDLDW